MWNLLFHQLLQRPQGFSAVKPYGSMDDGIFLISGVCLETLVELGKNLHLTVQLHGEKEQLKAFHKKRQQWSYPPGRGT